MYLNENIERWYGQSAADLIAAINERHQELLKEFGGSDDAAASSIGWEIVHMIRKVSGCNNS
jgi:hypothetical protein